MTALVSNRAHLHEGREDLLKLGVCGGEAGVPLGQLGQHPPLEHPPEVPGLQLGLLAAPQHGHRPLDVVRQAHHAGENVMPSGNDNKRSKAIRHTLNCGI